MRVGIIGYGTEGKASYDYWSARGAQITILDANPHTVVPDGVRTVLGPHYLADLSGYDLLVRSPGVRPDWIVSDCPVTSATREFFAVCKAPIIGVTGTKGKGTTSTLIAAILKAAGKTVWLGGNIGRAGLEFVDEVAAEHIVVMELSSYQLVDLDRSPQIGVCLMIVPEHVEWHGGMTEYAMAKAAISKYQSSEDLIVYNANNRYSSQIAELSVGRRLPYLQAPGAYVKSGEVVLAGQAICRTDEVGLIGPHNLENICAAVTATWELVGRDANIVGEAVRSFHGLPDRLEHVRDLDGVAWINDTFSVNPSATVAAIQSFDRPKVLIVGGFQRNLDLSEIAEVAAKADIRALITIGETGAALTSLFKSNGLRLVISGASTMAEIVDQAQAVARPGDVVLLSPGCASFDMFKNYKERGKEFVRAVQNLGTTT